MDVKTYLVFGVPPSRFVPVLQVKPTIPQTLLYATSSFHQSKLMQLLSVAHIYIYQRVSRRVYTLSKNQLIWYRHTKVFTYGWAPG